MAENIDKHANLYMYVVEKSSSRNRCFHSVRHQQSILECVRGWSCGGVRESHVVLLACACVRENACILKLRRVCACREFGDLVRMWICWHNGDVAVRKNFGLKSKVLMNTRLNNLTRKMEGIKESRQKYMKHTYICTADQARDVREVKDQSKGREIRAMQLQMICQ